jgi:hypothetical protein
VAFLDEHEQELFIDWVDQLVCVPKTDPERPSRASCWS